jgi:hypothetical protein
MNNYQCILPHDFYGKTDVAAPGKNSETLSKATGTGFCKSGKYMQKILRITIFRTLLLKKFLALFITS